LTLFQQAKKIKKGGLVGFMPLLSNLGSTGFILFCNIGSGILIARLLGPEDRGLLALVLAWPMLFAALSSFSLTDTVASKIASNKNVEETKANAFLIFILSSILGCITLLVTIKYFIVLPNSAERIIFYYMFFLIPLNHLSQVYVSFMQGYGRHKHWNLFRVLPHSLNLALVGLIWLFDTVSLESFAVANLASNFILVVAAYFISGKYFFLRTKYFKNLKSLLKATIKLHLSRSLSMIRIHSDKILLSLFVAPNDLGIFVVALTFSNVIFQLSTSLRSFIVPVFSKSKSDGNPIVGRNIYGLYALCFGVVASASMFFYIFSEFLVLNLFGPDYEGSSVLVKNLVIYSLIIGILDLLEPIFLVNNRILAFAVSEFAYLVSLAFCVFSFFDNVEVINFSHSMIISASVSLTIIATYSLVLVYRSRRLSYE
jgi:O-antigen/teichoic acid export membrane protein